MQIPIISGIAADETGDLRTAMPVNMLAVPKSNGVSEGYLRPADGIRAFGNGVGPDRGGVAWRGQLYRVMGSNFVRVEANGTVTVLADVGAGAQVSFDNSFDVLAIASGGSLFYWNGIEMAQVLDPDLGTVIDMIWLDGGFLTTDGEYLVQTDLNDRMSVNPLKYGSSEASPDRVVGLLRLNNAAHAVNRYTVEQFVNIGGTGFRYQRNEGAMLNRGAVGTHAACIFADQIAFLGGGVNEPPALWVGANGQTAKLSNREVDTLLQTYTETELSTVTLETRTDKAHQFLYVHLPDRCIVYDAAASQAVGQPVWSVLTSSSTGFSTYRARNMVWCYDAWICGDPTGNTIGVLDNTIGTHYGDATRWEFGTPIIYNGGMGALVHRLELVALPGRVALGADPIVWTACSEDGETWGREFSCKAGKQGERTARITWLRQGRMSNYRIQRFRGTSDAHIAFARLEAQLEPLNA